MMVRLLSSTRLVLLLAVFGLFGLSHAQAGSAPYASLHRALVPGLKLQRYPRLQAVQRILSKRPDVPASSIEVSILAAAGTIKVPIGADGRVNFPMTEALLAENPVVESNQPSGSLSISVSFEIAPPTTTTLSYEEFKLTIDEAAAALKELEGPYASASVAGIEFRMPSPDGSVTIESTNSEDLLSADSAGRIVVSFEPRLATVGSQIRFSAVPRQAFPHLRVVKTQ